MNKSQILAEYCSQLEDYEEVYRQIHRDPELSKQEVQTARRVAAHLKKLPAFAVCISVGGHGVVGLMKNELGPTVLLRADMNVLPHLETTGLDYASTKVMVGADEKRTPVMHACGHDMHTTVLMIVSTLLYSAKSH